MRLVHTSVATPIRVLVALCAPLLSAVAAQGETVNIRDLMVSYTSQSASGAQGTIKFNLRFDSFTGSPDLYDAFSSQVRIRQVVMDAPAIFTLQHGPSEAISADSRYWLQPLGDPVATAVGAVFLFEDGIGPVPPAVTPLVDDILAHYVIGFDVGPGGFGAYRIEMSDQAANFFSRGISLPTDVTITPDPSEDTFPLVAPEPTSGLLLLLGGTIMLRRRRRRSLV